MNEAGIFVVGVIVSLLVGGAMGLLVWGAVLDGRAQREMESGRARGSAATQTPG